jgi:hypothetical protein
MTRYWWVNHKQTVRQEIAGNYLWSPKAEANGVRSQFYDNLRIAEPGDFILSFASAEISFIGQVADFALSSPKPEEFGSVGIYWNREGWLLPVMWKSIPNPISPQHLLPTIAALLPPKYSPIHPRTGRGNQKAYLAEISHPLFSAIIEHAHITEKELADEMAGLSQASFHSFSERLELAVEETIISDPSLGSTEKEQLLKARRGQGVFRANVGRIECGCRLTLIRNPKLLLASHIKPWRSCTTSLERLDGNNGLLLAPHVDLLFDRGLITFTDDGDVIVSSKLSSSDVDQLGLAGACRKNSGKFLPAQKLYLQYHRNVVFIP